jgi:hypothetical protein
MWCYGLNRRGNCAGPVFEACDSVKTVTTSNDSRLPILRLFLGARYEQPSAKTIKAFHDEPFSSAVRGPLFPDSETKSQTTTVSR